MDLKLTNDDLDFTNGELSFVTGQAAIAQHIDMRLSAWVGELGLKYDRSAGVPYLQVLFGQKNPNLSAVHAILLRKIQDTPGVISAKLDVLFDRTARTLQATGKATTIHGNVDFSKLIEVAP